MPNGARVNGAYVLENCFPTATGVRMRAGSAQFAELFNTTLPVVSMFAYANGNNKKLFAANANSLYDVTSPAFPSTSLLVDDLGDNLVDDLGNFIIGQASLGAPAVASLTGGAWSAVQFATPGGVFLRAVNGSDTPLVFDGTSWATTPAITVVDPTTLSYVWVHQRRLFFFKKDSLSARCLPPAPVCRPAGAPPLPGRFPPGASLL